MPIDPLRTADETPSPSEVTAAICEAICEVASVDGVTGSTKLRDIALNSLDLLEVFTILEDRFDRDIDAIRLLSNGQRTTVEDLACAFVTEAKEAADRHLSTPRR